MKPREWSWFNRAFFALFVVVLIGVIVFLAWRQSVASEERAQLIDALTQSQAQLRSEGIEPDAPEADQIVQGVVGPPGKSGDQGPRGPSGADGANATDAQVAAALANWCTTFGCNGPTGSNGRDGTNGTNGRDGADSTIPGPVGPVGPQGSPGPEGRGIQSTYCDDTTGRWTVTYTDSTTADAGVCRTTLIEGVTP